MKGRQAVLGIDTSNYKTSVAAVGRKGEILCDLRTLLEVKQGEKGLRQSDALFQHVKNLPMLLEGMMKELKELDRVAGEKPPWEFGAVCYSAKPRPAEDSYMPVFLAGESLARSLGAAMNLPVLAFSHQEGHVEAVKYYSELKEKDRFLACHFSGGTCEILQVSAVEKEGQAYEIRRVGGSKDISFGQVLDRAGVAMGFKFPAGEALDKLALSAQENGCQEDCGGQDARKSGRTAPSEAGGLLTPIKVREGSLNLSGIDTQMKRILAERDPNTLQKGPLTCELFARLAAAMEQMILQTAEMTGETDVVMAGGVSSSQFLRRRLGEALHRKGLRIVFDGGDLSQDNAVGTALLGGKYLWD